MRFLKKYAAKAILASLFLGFGFSAKSQNVIYISEEGVYQLLRVNVGLTSMSSHFRDSTPYTAYGLHLSNEVKIISAFWDVDNKFTIHDGFYLDMNFGKTGPHDDKTIASGQTHPRGRGAFSVNMGYFCLAGYRTQPWGVLGGIDFRWRQSSVAKLTMPNLDGPLLYFSCPLLLRLEKGLDKENPNQRAALTLGSTLSDKKRAGFQNIQLEYGITDNGRWNLFAQYLHQAATAEDTYYFRGALPAVYNQFTFGLRVGNLP